MTIHAAVAWTRRVTGILAISGVALLFLPAERVAIPTEYGGSVDGATVIVGADGPSLYAEHCSSCHGLSAAGGRGPGLAGRLDTIGRKNARKRIGEGGLQMPSFENTLTTSEIEAILDHLSRSPYAGSK